MRKYSQRTSLRLSEETLGRLQRQASILNGEGKPATWASIGRMLIQLGLARLEETEGGRK